MISLIFAMDKNNLIGKGNDLPWNYPEDLKFFKNKTSGKTVAMGLLTYKSIFDRIKKPLPNRKNIVFCFENKKIEGVEVNTNLIKFLEDNKNSKQEIFIIGGKSIYDQSMKYASKMYITHINKEYEGNVYFPDIDYSKWNKIDATKSGDLEFATYKRK